MFCQQCGAQIEDGLTFCTNCGAMQIEATTKSENNKGINNTQRPVTYAYQNIGASVSPKRVGFIEAVKLFFINYVNFTGRSTVSEYWWAFLFNFLVNLCVSWIPGVRQLISLGLFIPGLSLGIRRLHDTGKPWYYIFMSMIPLVGFIIIIVRYCMVSDADNKWGPAPRI